MQQALLDLKRTRALVLVFVLILAPSCGPDPADEPPPQPTSPAIPDLPPVPAAERARFALTRLLEGPQTRTARYRILHIQELNLDNAQHDLVALREETLRLLADQDLRTDVTKVGPDGFGKNSWHSILDVLARLPGCPVDLAIAWSAPATETKDLQLHRRAAKVLAATQDEAASPVLLTLLRRRATDREAALTAGRALLEAGSPWREQALATLLASGDARIWVRTAHLLEPLDDPASEDALAWWALLMETGGPKTISETTRVVRPHWAVLGLLLGDDVWPFGALDLSLARRHGLVAAPASVLEAPGLLPPSGEGVDPLPWRTLLVEGRGAAAGARCALALAGYDSAIASVRIDHGSLDPVLSGAARACPVSENASPADAVAEATTVLDLFLWALKAGDQPDPVGVALAIRTLAKHVPEEMEARAWRVLALARPYARYELVLKVAYEALAERDDGRLLDTVTPWVNGEDPDDRATGLGLVKWARDVRYAAPVAAGLPRASPAEAGTRWRLLVWLWSSPDTSSPNTGVPPDERAAFVERFAAWLASVGDAEASTLAPGLFDLGPAGSQAYAAGLSGARRNVYVRGLLTRTRPASLEVAAALLAPLDGKTPTPERRAVLVAAYRTAPATAASHLAAARLRLDPPDREEVDDILEAVRHRADR